MLDPPAVSSITVITDTFCTHNDAGIEQKMNIIVPIIISSHLPQSSQPSPGLTRLPAAAAGPQQQLWREREREREGNSLRGFIYIYIRAQGDFNRSIILGYIVQSIMLFFWQIPVILFVSRGPPFVLVTSEPFYPGSPHCAPNDTNSEGQGPRSHLHTNWGLILENGFGK